MQSPLINVKSVGQCSKVVRAKIDNASAVVWMDTSSSHIKVHVGDSTLHVTGALAIAIRTLSLSAQFACCLCMTSIISLISFDLHNSFLRRTYLLGKPK